MKACFRLVVSLALASFVLAIVSPLAHAYPVSWTIETLYEGSNAFAHIEALCSFGPRVAGGPAEKVAANYISTQMESYGLSVEVQEFPVIYFVDNGSMLEVVDGPVLNPNTMAFSPAGEFTVEVVDCGLGYPVEFPSGVIGNIALVQRGGLYFWQKTQNAANAGAVATIIYNNVPGNFLGSLTFVTDIPAVAISREEGTLLLDLLAGGSVTVYLKVDTVASESTSQNVIGTLEGFNPTFGIVYLGAHYDSVSAGLGANDDASGVAAMLEAARVLSIWGRRPKATLKFIAFGAEETGLDGSYYYVSENEEEVETWGIGMINLDMIAVGNVLLIGNIGWGGSSLLDFTKREATAMNMSWQPFTAGSNSDHTYFEMEGVPSVFLNQSPDPWFHTSEDTPDKIDITILEVNGELATATMYDWATPVGGLIHIGVYLICY
jgi:aminopeptidase YwaD